MSDEGIVSDPAREKSCLTVVGRSPEHYSWDAHVRSYLEEVGKILPAGGRPQEEGSRKLMAQAEKWIVMDLPPHLEDEPDELVHRWRELFKDERHRAGLRLV